jgi:hypothetical protein
MPLCLANQKTSCTFNIGLSPNLRQQPLPTHFVSKLLVSMPSTYAEPIALLPDELISVDYCVARLFNELVHGLTNGYLTGFKLGTSSERYGDYQYQLLTNSQACCRKPSLVSAVKYGVIIEYSMSLYLVHSGLRPPLRNDDCGGSIVIILG